MAQRDVGLLAISPSDDLRYLLGFAPTAGERLCALLLGRDEELAVVPSVNAEQLHDAVSGLELLRWDDADGPAAALEEALARFDLDGAAVGVDGTMRADTLLRLQAARPSARAS